jgi:hypothetical protein
MSNTCDIAASGPLSTLSQLCPLTAFDVVADSANLADDNNQLDKT